MPPPPPPPPPIPLATLRRSSRLFWCHQCRRPIALLTPPSAPFPVFCPRCFGRFIHDLDIPLPPPPPPPAYFLLDFPSHRPRLFLPLTPFHYPRLPLPPPPSPLTSAANYSVPTTVDPGDYFTGPNLGELIDDLSQNDRTGPPPASTSSIGTLPTVAITVAHLRGGSECPVCKEEFAVGEEAREMPCLHVFHSHCIVPWLRMHNSCPVCRFQLSDGEPAAREQRRGRSAATASGAAGGGNRRRERRQAVERWNPFTALSASRGSPPTGWEQQYSDDRRERGGEPMDSAAAFYTWWRSLFLF